MDLSVKLAAGTGLLALGLALVFALACSAAGDDPGATGGSGGAGAGGAGAAAQGGSGGLPTTTLPGTWSTFDPTTLPSCGVGCRMVFGPLAHPGDYGFAYDAKSAAGVFGYADVVKNTPFGARLYVEDRVVGSVGVYAPEDGVGLGEPGVSTRGFSFLRTNPGDINAGSVVVTQRDGQSSRIFATYDQKKDHPTLPVDYGVLLTGINDTYVFWLRDGEGWYRGNLETGETKLLVPQANLYMCDSFVIAPDGIVCGTTSGFRALFVDQESGTITLLSPEGNAIQEDTTASPDGRLVAWVDYRDPPGPPSTDSFRYGGEVYVHDRVTKITKRVSFDSPAAPRGKTRPAIGDGDIVTWLETCKTCPPNPENADELYSLTKTLVRLDLASGKKCRLPEKPEFRRGARSTLFGHTWYHYVKVGATKQDSSGPYLAALDLDHPDLPWECE